MKQSSKKTKKPLITIFVVVVLILLILMSPLFAVDEVIVSGNKRYSEREIAEMAGANEGSNIFKFSYSNAEKKLLSEDYIRDAKVAINLPNKVNIDIIERKTCGYVPYMGTYLYIDSDGFVIENGIDLKDKCPIVTGLTFSEFTLGEPLKVENTEAFDIVMTMSRLLLNYDFIDEVKEMNISAPDNIHLYIDNIDVSFGDIYDADKKIRIVIEIMKTLQEGDKGVLHIEDTKNTPYFTYTL